MVTARFRLIALVGVLLALCALMLVGSAGAQGFPSLPSLTGTSSSQPSYMNPFGAPGSPHGSDTVPLSSGLFGAFLPRIPNLEFGFVYAIGPNLRAGRGTIDYVLPISPGNQSVVFGEAHAEFQDFWKSQKVSSTTGPGFVAFTTPANNRTDLSFGGGYRRILGGNTLFGVNGFFDTTKIFERWYSAGGVGLEMVSNLSDNAAVDVRANWYGNLFSRDVFINAFRNKGGSYDIGVGYNHALFDQALDLRLSFTGYEFDVGDAVYGYKTGAGLTTRDGVFSVKYEHGYDRVNNSYDEIGGFVNVGFQVENLLRGESPVTSPEPVYKSPRSLTYWLTQQVKRNWHQPTAVVLSRTGAVTSNAAAAGGRRLVFLGVTNIGLSAIQNVNLSAATFDLVLTSLGTIQLNLLSYQFRMSDNSIQDVRATILPISDPASIIAINAWSPSFSPVAGPAPMNASNADTFLTFGQFHRLDVQDSPGTHTATVTVTLDVLSDPSIVPLVITITVKDLP
jgi:hypothetical protein